MSANERRKRAKDQLRQAILSAAEEIIISEGYAHLSMRKIAERIEYSPTTIYHYFKDKSELVNTLIEENFAALLAMLEASAGDDRGDPVACLRRTQRTFVEFGLANPDHYRLIFLSGLGIDSPTPEGSDSKGIALLRELVSSCIEKGQFRQADPELVTQTLWSSVHGLTSLMITYPGFSWVQRDLLIEFAIDATIGGLMADKSGR